jgi:hypothetical protein
LMAHGTWSRLDFAVVSLSKDEKPQCREIHRSTSSLDISLLLFTMSKHMFSCMHLTPTFEGQNNSRAPEHALLHLRSHLQ